MNSKKLYGRIRQGNLNNIRLNDFIKLIEDYGFRFHRQRGSHKVFYNPELSAIMNIQPDKNGNVKPYQIRQFLQLIEK